MYLAIGAHANLLILDVERWTVERFEPNGNVYDTDDQPWYSVSQMDATIEKYFDDIAADLKIEKKLKYLAPNDYWKYEDGIQDKMQLGYCYIVIFFWMDIRLNKKFSRMELTELAKVLSETLVITGEDWRRISHSYIFGISPVVYEIILKRAGIPNTRFPTLVRK